MYHILSIPLSFQYSIVYEGQEEAMNPPSPVNGGVTRHSLHPNTEGTSAAPIPQLCFANNSPAQDTEDHCTHWIQGLMHTRQVLYHWAALLASRHLISAVTDCIENLIQKSASLLTLVGLTEMEM